MSDRLDIENGGQSMPKQTVRRDGTWIQNYFRASLIDPGWLTEDRGGSKAILAELDCYSIGSIKRASSDLGHLHYNVTAPTDCCPHSKGSSATRHGKLRTVFFSHAAAHGIAP